MLATLRNMTVNLNRYREHDEAVIISCFFNPQKSPYRTKAFKTFYESIKHMNHLILECVIGDAKPELEENDNIQRVHTENLLWHKEALLNLAVSKLPAKYRYIFWVDADVTFTNKNWLLDGVREFKKGAQILQPFEYCVHLGKDEKSPSFDVQQRKEDWINGVQKLGIRPEKQMWRSFCANYVDGGMSFQSQNYDVHGHVGFAWGATRELLESVPLYDKALIGGADHIIAHAAAGQIDSHCIEKSFTEDLEAVKDWMREFYKHAAGSIGYVKGDLYHMWHGDIEKRQYLKRVQDFTPTTKSITEKDENGLYVAKKGEDEYVKQYFDQREVKKDTPASKPQPTKKTSGSTPTVKTTHHHHHTSPANDGFLTSMIVAQATDNPMLGMVVGGNPAGAMVGGMMGHKNHPYDHKDTGHSHTQSGTSHHHGGHDHANENFS